MSIDPLEHAPLEEDATTNNDGENDDMDDDYYTHIEVSNVWTTWRDNLATEMFEQWRGSRQT